MVWSNIKQQVAIVKQLAATYTHGSYHMVWSQIQTVRWHNDVLVASSRTDMWQNGFTVIVNSYVMCELQLWFGNRNMLWYDSTWSGPI